MTSQTSEPQNRGKPDVCHACGQPRAEHTQDERRNGCTRKPPIVGWTALFLKFASPPVPAIYLGSDPT